MKTISWAMDSQFRQRYSDFQASLPTLEKVCQRDSSTLLAGLCTWGEYSLTVASGPHWYWI